MEIRFPQGGWKLKSLTETLGVLVQEYVQGLRANLVDDLVSVVLFGSVARGEVTPQSDIDLFIVVNDLPGGGLHV